MGAERKYAWESFPEYVATQQYSRCLGRVLAGLPGSAQRRLVPALCRGAVLIAQAIAGAHAELPPGEEVPVRGRELYRDTGLDAVAASREAMLMLRRERLGRAAEIGAALELLERIEAGLRERPLGPHAAPGT